MSHAAKNTQLNEDGLPFSFTDLFLELDDQFCIPQVWFTKEGYGPVTVIARWERGFAHPLYLVTNFELPMKPCIGIKNVSKSRPSSPMKKAVGSFSTKAIFLIRTA